MRVSIFIIVLTYIVSVVYGVSLNDNGSSYTLKNDYATVVIAKSSGYITSLKIAGNNQEYLNRSYIDANGGKVYFSAKKKFDY